MAEPCPIEALFPSGSVPCILPKGHGGKHQYTPADDAVRALGTVECAHGAPLTVGVYRGKVNIAGRMLDEDQAEFFGVLFVRACWEAARGGGRDD